MKAIGKQTKRKAILSIFAIAVFLLGGNTGFSQTAPTFTVCPGFPELILPAGDGGLTLNSANIPSLLGVTAVDPDGAETITYSASPSTITCADIGPGFSIAVTATDSDGSDVCNITVDIFDGGPFANCNDITVNLDAAGNYVIAPNSADAMALSMGSSACSGITTVSVMPNTFSCTDVGTPVQVTVTVTDGLTATAFCLANVTVLDGTNPMITCPPTPAAVNNAAGTCAAPVTLALATATDGCGVTITNSFNAGGANASGTYPVGTTTVTFTATDPAGNTATCDVDVTVNDTETPVAMCNNITVELDASGNYSLTAANLSALSNGSTDNCTLTTTSSQTMFTCTDIGTASVTVTVSDGTNSANCTAFITVEDNMNPTQNTCPMDITQANDAGMCSAVVTYATPTFDDNCGGTGQTGTLTAGFASGNAFPVGTTTVTYTFTDAGGNSVTCSFDVTVTDSEAPMVTNPGNMDVNNAANQCEATVSWPTLSGSDNCPGSVTVTYTATDPKGNPITILTAGANDFADFSVGVSTVNYSVSDAAMPVNTTSGSFTVTVRDNEAPTIACPATTTVIFSSCNGAGAMVADYRGNASINDNCTGYTVTQSPAPGTLLSDVMGVTPANGESYTVPLTVTDNFSINLSSDCMFTINLTESDDPEPSVAGGVLPTIDFTCGGPLTVAAPTATDACGNLICGTPFPASIATNVGPACSGGGAAGPPVTYTSNVVVPIADATPAGTPSTLSVSDPNISIDDINVTLDINHIWVGDLRATLTSPSGTTVELFDRPGVPAGAFGCPGNDLDVTFDDEAAATAAVFENTCNNAPAISGDFQPTFSLAMFDGEDPNGNWTLTVSDNALFDTGSIISWSLDIATLSTSTSITNYEFPNGMHNVTWVYDDGNGNTSNQLQTINVSADVVLPEVSCQDITLELDGTGNASAAADDLVAATGFTMEMTEDFGDNANNPGRVSMSVTATSNVTFTFDYDYDNMDAGFEGLFYLVNGTGATANGTLIASADDSGTTSVSLMAGDVFTLQLFSPDNLFGESSSVEITNFSPGFTGDYSIGNWTFGESGVLNAAMAVIDGDPSDDCTDLVDLLPTLALSQSTFDCSDVGAAIPVTLSVTDEAGNVGSCVAMVTVVDVMEPVLTVTSGSVADITVECDDVQAATQVVTANDNCDGMLTVTPGETSTQSNNSASCAFYNYEITRTWSATDANSNTGTIEQVITVEDNTAPANPMFNSNIPNSDIVSTDAVGCTASITLAVTSYDDCAAFGDLTITNNSAFANANGADASGDYPRGMYNILFTATDPCGNTSNWTESFEVVDQVAPVASCVNDLNLGLPASGILTLSPNAVDNNSFDECSGVTLTVTPNMFTCADVGTPRTVTLTATDAAGNSSSCTTTVNIQDNNAPTALCRPVTVTLDSDGNASITAADVNNGSFDDCSAVTVSVSPNTFTSADLTTMSNPPVNVILTVTDASNNVTRCNASVTVLLPQTCFNIGVQSGGTGETVSVPVTASNFTALVGFQYELVLNTPDDADFVGISNIHPDLTNTLQENLIVTDSFISMIDSMTIIGSMGQDSVTYDTTYTDNFDRMSISWNQFNTDGMGDLVPVTLSSTDTLFELEVLLTGNITGFSTIDLGPTVSMTTPPQVIYSFGSGFIPADACVVTGAVSIGELIISGDIFNESGNAINLVDVDLYVPPIIPGVSTPIDDDITGPDGAYTFTLNTTGNFEIVPNKNINWSNGIDILDVSLIQRHSVGNPYVNSAYKKIAADVSGDGLITTFDAVLLNSYLASLFMDAPPPTDSWQFVDAAQSLDNLPDASVPAFNNTIVLLGQTSDASGNDFVAVKTGDLGGLVTADTMMVTEGPEGRSDKALKFLIEDRALKAGDQISIDLSAENFEDMIAYQWILEFDNDVLTYNGFDNVNLNNLGELGFGEVIINDGKLVLTWFSGNAITKATEDLLFSLNFDVKKDARQLSDLLSVTTHERMDAVAYQGDETQMDVELSFTEPTLEPSVFALNQNTPNPFKDETVISFTLPEATAATVTIMDVTGRILKVYEGDFTQGYNEISVNRGELPQAGTLFYELKTPEHTASMKMIVID